MSGDDTAPFVRVRLAYENDTTERFQVFGGFAPGVWATASVTIEATEPVESVAIVFDVSEGDPNDGDAARVVDFDAADLHVEN